MDDIGNELQQLNARVVQTSGSPSSNEFPIPAPLGVLLGSLDAIHNKFTKRPFHPPTDRKSKGVNIRFGDPIFRDWKKTMSILVPRIMKRVVDAFKDEDSAGDTGNNDWELVGRVVVEDFCREREGEIEIVDNINDTNGVNNVAPIPTPSAASDQSIGPYSINLVVKELTSYLLDAFGNTTRLDYGTGHEACALLFGVSLWKLAEVADQEGWKKQHFATFFRAYLNITREVQTIYVLEPAGSHGVWGLDDYHCLNFWLGAFEMEGLEAGLGALLAARKRTDDDTVVSGAHSGAAVDYSKAQLPSCIHDVSVCPPPDNDQGILTPRTTIFTEKFMYMSSIAHIKNLKPRVPFAEGSPMLNDISGLPSWGKLRRGMARVWEGEVLKKFVVIQHWRFGEILRSFDGVGESSWKGGKDPLVDASATEMRKNKVAGGAPQVKYIVNASGVKVPINLGGGTEGTSSPMMPMMKAPWAKK